MTPLRETEAAFATWVEGLLLIEKSCLGRDSSYSSTTIADEMRQLKILLRMWAAKRQRDNMVKTNAKWVRVFDLHLDRFMAYLTDTFVTLNNLGEIHLPDHSCSFPCALTLRCRQNRFGVTLSVGPALCFALWSLVPLAVILSIKFKVRCALSTHTASRPCFTRNQRGFVLSLFDAFPFRPLGFYLRRTYHSAASEYLSMMGSIVETVFVRMLSFVSILGGFLANSILVGHEVIIHESTQ